MVEVSWKFSPGPLLRLLDVCMCVLLCTWLVSIYRGSGCRSPYRGRWVVLWYDGNARRFGLVAKNGEGVWSCSVSMLPAAQAKEDGREGAHDLIEDGVG